MRLAIKIKLNFYDFRCAESRRFWCSECCRLEKNFAALIVFFAECMINFNDVYVAFILSLIIGNKTVVM